MTTSWQNRTLHFTQHGMLWECNTNCRTKVGQIEYNTEKLANRGMRLKMLIDNDPSLVLPRHSVCESYYAENHTTHITDYFDGLSDRFLHWAWQGLVSGYSNRSWTQTNDKLTALSGLTCLMAECLKVQATDYLAGLWWKDSASVLLWYVCGPFIPPRSKSYRAPSWSWASVDGGIEYFKEHYQFIFVNFIDVVEAYCEPSSPWDITGRVKSGKLVLRGDLQPIKLQVTCTVPKGYKPVYNGGPGTTSRSANPKSYIWGSGFEVLLDDGSRNISKLELWLDEGDNYFFRVGITMDTYTDGERTWWLVWRRLDGVNTFERIGLGYHQSKFSLGTKLFTTHRPEVIIIILIG